MPPRVVRVGGAALVVLAAALVWPAAAHAGELEDFEIARNAYESQNYSLSVTRFEALLPRLQTRALILESRKYLAASYLFVDRRPDAESQFEQLLRADPTYELDPIAFPTEVLDVFSSVRATIRRQLNAEIEARRRAEEEARRHEQERLEGQRRRVAQLLDLAGTETVEHQSSRVTAMIPFGIGQFQNGNVGLGLAFAIGEGVLAMTTVISWIIHENIPANAADVASASVAEEAWRLTNQISFVVLIAAAVGGVVEAQLNFASSTRTTRRRRVPPDLLEAVQVSLGPGGFRLEF